MGIWDELRLTAVKLFNRSISNTLLDTNENQYFYDMEFAKAVTRIGDAVRSSGARKLKEHVPDPDRREKIGQIISDIGKFAVDSRLGLLDNVQCLSFWLVEIVKASLSLYANLKFV